MPSISSFEITNLVIQDPSIFFWIAESFGDAAAVNLNGIKTLLVMVPEVPQKILLIVLIQTVKFLLTLC